MESEALPFSIFVLDLERHGDQFPLIYPFILIKDTRKRVNSNVSTCVKLILIVGEVGI